MAKLLQIAPCCGSQQHTSKCRAHVEAIPLQPPSLESPIKPSRVTKWSQPGIFGGNCDLPGTDLSDWDNRPSPKPNRPQSYTGHLSEALAGSSPSRLVSRVLQKQALLPG